MKITLLFQEPTEGFHWCTPKVKTKLYIKMSKHKLKINFLDVAKYTKCKNVLAEKVE